MAGISVADTTLDTTVANLGWDEVRFPKPVFIGDTLRVETTVEAMRDSQSRPDAGIVTFVHRCFNQRNVEVGQCRRLALMRRQPREQA
jgi:acyl dehydratase